MSDTAVRERVTAVLRDILQQALDVTPEEIVPKARVIDDLGAESIDLLDIRFRVERALGLRITNAELTAAFSAAKSAEEFRRLFTVGAMGDYLVGRLEQAGG